MSVPLALLGLLEREPSHGYDLKRDYDAYFGRGKPLPFGQVYATLGRLARDGKVVVGEAEPGAGPDRKRYVITEQGVTEVETWLAEPVDARAAPADGAVRQGRAGADVGPPGRGVPGHAAGRAPAADARADRASSAPAALVDALLADHGLFHLEADLRWIDLTAARLDALAEAGAAMIAAGRPPAPSAPIEARDVRCPSGATPALRGASVAVDGRRDPGGDGPERLGQVDAAALPGRHPGARRRRGPLRRPAHRHAARAASAARCGATGSASCSSSASSCPELTAEENVALPLLLGGTRRREALARGARVVRPARPGRAGAAPLRRAVRRAGAAGRAGPRPGRRARGAVRRRADRLAGLADRRAGHGAAGRRRPRAGHHRRAGHPRAPGRRLRRPRGHRPRRQGHLAAGSRSGS